MQGSKIGLKQHGLRQEFLIYVRRKTRAEAFSGCTVVVLTSSKGDEDSLEDPKWNHGAFSKVLLTALDGDAANSGSGPISVEELIAYLAKNVPALTNGAQHLGVSPDFEHLATNILIVGK